MKLTRSRPRNKICQKDKIKSFKNHGNSFCRFSVNYFSRCECKMPGKVFITMIETKGGNES